MNETLYWVWLTTALKLTPGSIRKALYKFSPEEAYAATSKKLEASGLDDKLSALLSDKSLDRAMKIVKVCNDKGIKIIHTNSPEYPRALDRLADKPAVLYVRGDIECLRGKKTSAFIGTRRMSELGMECAEATASRLLDNGNILISGIADGIDAMAAKVSLSRGAPTVAVLGVDIDKYYPKANERLIDRVAQEGAVISEYPPNTGARFFASRNRIIVGLSDSVHVIEAPEDSGALIGARLAFKLRIPVYSFDLDGDSFAGCRELISNGAIPLNKERVKAISEQASVKRTPVNSGRVKTARDIPDGIQGTRRHIWSLLLDGPKNEDDMVNSEHNIAEILTALTELELDGYIKTLPGGKYVLK